MLWRVINNKEEGWMFFNLNDEQQKKIINNELTDTIVFRYTELDQRVVQKIIKRIERGDGN